MSYIELRCLTFAFPFDIRIRDEILTLPFPNDATLWCVTTATLRYARGVAFAVQGDVAAAEKELLAFSEVFAAIPNGKPPNTRVLHNNISK
jgi:hypothetical protein